MRISVSEARRIGNKLKVDWSKVSIKQFQKGLEDEYGEHKKALGGSLLKAGMVVCDHLKIHPAMYRK
jgi:hypothetical protein